MPFFKDIWDESNGDLVDENIEKQKYWEVPWVILHYHLQVTYGMHLWYDSQEFDLEGLQYL